MTQNVHDNLPPVDRPGAWQNVKASAGSLRSERVLQALEDGQVNVRPHDLAQAFSLAGRQLGAADTALARTDSSCGPWARLFQSEPAYLFAQILSFEPDWAAMAFAEAIEAEPDHACRMLSELAGTVKAWLKRIELDCPDVFSKQIYELNRETSLSSHLDQFANAKAKSVREGAISLALIREPHLRTDAIGLARAMRSALRRSHSDLRSAVATLQQRARIAFDERIQSGLIDPGLGLILAELRTTHLVDEKINAFQARHTDFYYQEIIGQSPAPASAERVLLGVGPVTTQSTLPATSRLEALGTDGQVTSFETEAAAPLSPARIGSVATLSFDTDEKIQFNRVLGGITRVRASKMTVSDGGHGKDTLFYAGDDVPVRMGFDLETPMLAMAEGLRRIDMHLRMERTVSLPAQSNLLDKEEALKRSEMRAKAKRVFAEGTARPEEQSLLVHLIDPGIRLALSSDHALTEAFATTAGLRGLEDLARAATQYAAHAQKTPSLALLYEFLSERVEDGATDSEAQARLRLLLGRILTLGLLERVPMPKGKYLDRLQKLMTAHGLVPPPELPGRPREKTSMIFAAFLSTSSDGMNNDRINDVFQALLGDILSIQISTPDGLRSPDIMQVLPIRDTQADAGITIAMRYNESAPALEGSGPDSAPKLALRYATASHLCPVSFFEAYSIEAIALEVKVAGLKSLSAFSDIGPLVTDQTFQPFGARPNDGAQFQIGCAEMARKPVTHVGVDLSWTSFPTKLGGFEAHYDTYGKDVDVPRPTLRIDYLGGDGWKAVSEGSLPMIHDDGITGTLVPDWTFTGEIQGKATAAAGVVLPREFTSRQTVRAGLVRMTLAGTANGFNASQYPLVLVNAMRPRINPFRKQDVPPEPFVPTIANITLGYRAKSVIALNSPESARAGERITQIGPFGQAEVFPMPTTRQMGLFPKRLGYGHLFLQITGARPTGPKTIAFEMDRLGHLRTIPPPNPLRWYYLSPRGWSALPETAMLSDTTSGLMRSGLIVVDVPEDATDQSTEMPSGGVWLAAVAQDPDLATFPALRQVRVNGVWVRRKGEASAPRTGSQVWSFNPAQGGLNDIKEISQSAKVRPPELRSAFKARISERLRHRKRAITPWDYERLVLQEFPDVWMAKSLPHLDRHDPAPAPGKTTFVAVRKPQASPDQLRAMPDLFDVATLEEIRNFLTGLMPSHVHLDVVNPAYERLQVRARITIDRTREQGAMGQTLNRALNKYLSVWSAGPALRRFGWKLNTTLLRAYVAELPYVRNVTDFSVLHLSHSDTLRHELLDTAQGGVDRRGSYGPILSPRRPWGLPLSSPTHLLEVTHKATEVPATVSGIGSLPVGEMLIVSQRTVP